MASQNLSFSRNTPHGGLLASALSQLERGRQDLINLKGTIDLMISGDNSLDASFDVVKDKFGFDTTTTARAAWLELSSALSKLTTDASVSSTQAALIQMFNKFR